MSIYSSNGNPLPPFGRVLLAYQQESITLNHPIYIYVGKNAKDEAFAQKKLGLLVTFLSLQDDACRFRWPVRDQKLVVIDTGAMSLNTLTRFCLHLLTFDPRVIFLYSDEHPNQLILPPGRNYHG